MDFGAVRLSLKVRALVLALCLFALSQPAHAFFDHTPARIGAMGLHRQIIGTGKPVILGDSNTEGMWWNYVCNSAGWIVNGGIGGIRVKEMLDNINGLIIQVQPSVATLMIGTNDAAATQVGTPEDSNWESNYNALVTALQTAGVTPTLFTVPPVEQGKPLGQGYFLTTQIQRFNTHIRAQATARNLPLRDVYAAWSNPQGYMPAGGTIDGVHLSRPYQVDYFYHLQAGVQSALAKEGRTCP